MENDSALFLYSNFHFFLEFMNNITRVGIRVNDKWQKKCGHVEEFILKMFVLHHWWRKIEEGRNDLASAPTSSKNLSVNQRFCDHHLRFNTCTSNVPERNILEINRYEQNDITLEKTLRETRRVAIADGMSTTAVSRMNVSPGTRPTETRMAMLIPSILRTDHWQQF